MADLFCDSCKKVHHLATSWLERIVYALQGDLVDTALIAKSGAKDDIDALAPEPECLLSVLDGSNDIERYAEHVESLVEARKGH